MDAERHETRRSGLQKKLAVSGVSLLIACGAAELGLRLVVDLRPSRPPGYDEVDFENYLAWVQGHPDGRVDMGGHEHHPVLGWVPRPGLVGYMGIGLAKVSTNSVGMRGRREFAREKPAGVRRIVLLGDSFTFGNDEIEENIWPTLIQKRLPDTEVLNLGVSGYGLDQSLLMLLERGLAYEPDVVLWCVFVGDLDRSRRRFSSFSKPLFELRDGELELTGTPVPHPQELLDRAFEDPSPWSYVLELLRRHGETERARNGFLLSRAIFERAAAEAERVGARLLVTVVPGGNERLPRERMIEDLCGRAGIEYFDAREVFAEQFPPGGPDAFGPRGHFSPAGHRAFARAVLRGLKEPEPARDE